MQQSLTLLDDGFDSLYLNHMLKLINKRLKLLKDQLKETKVSFEEHDNSEDMYLIDQLVFTIKQFKTFKEEVKVELAEG